MSEVIGSGGSGAEEAEEAEIAQLAPPCFCAEGAEWTRGPKAEGAEIVAWGLKAGWAVQG